MFWKKQFVCSNNYTIHFEIFFIIINQRNLQNSKGKMFDLKNKITQEYQLCFRKEKKKKIKILKIKKHKFFFRSLFTFFKLLHFFFFFSLYI